MHTSKIALTESAALLSGNSHHLMQFEPNIEHLDPRN
jgi:hypothetical protein